jgi:N-acetylglucosaminyldiphosphoundecaprenol N-acetyl-beta-D-mannosaminyltransferase
MARERVCYFLKYGKRPHSIFAANPEKNFSFPKDPQLLEAFRNADLLLPDGVGIVWAARILFGAILERVPGSDFILDICKLTEKYDYSVFIFGANEKINQAAVKNLKKQFHYLKVAGRCNGYISDGEMPTLINRINESRAEVLFLALGSPNQEKWFAKYNGELKFVKVCQCIGGTLDTIAGNVKRAPEIWQRYCVEWLYRLIIEPSRIKRQKLLPLFVFSVLKMKLKHLLR